MITTRPIFVTATLGLIAICACSGDSANLDPRSHDPLVDQRPHSPRNYAMHQSGTRDWSDPVLAESVARADLLIVTSSLLWNGGHLEASDVPSHLRAYNPDCRVIGYILAESVRLDWADKRVGSYGRTLYDRLAPYWSYTTTGDTLSNWPGLVVVNILDPDCRAVIVDTFVDYHAQSATQFDGVFWDYFSNQVWIPDFVSCEGYADLDGNGVGQSWDPEERAAYRLAQEDLVTRLRAATGDRFIQILNGRRANSDATLASLGDGLNYELFPTMEFPGHERMRAAVDPDEPISLWHAVTWPRTAAGGPFLLLENANSYRYTDHLGEVTDLPAGDLYRVLGFLFDGVCPVWAPNGEYKDTWPTNPLDLGAPVGPTRMDGDVFTREFTRGHVWMELKGGDWPDPFRYRITLDGNVVEEFDLPYHFP